MADDVGDIAGAAWAAERTRLGGAFTRGAAAYERLRPDYPIEAVRWAVEHAPDGPVADIGAGTGKLTAALLDVRPRHIPHDSAAACPVVAVEPSADMLARLTAAYPQAEARLASGESTGLPDDSVAAVVYGQAWHWVDPGAASREAARVLRPGGVLALLWNLFDDTDPATAALDAAIHGRPVHEQARDGSASAVEAPFVADGTRDFTWEWRTTTQALAELVTTRSHYLAADEDERGRLRGLVDATVAEHYGPVGDRPATVRHRTVVHRFRLR